MLVKLYLGSIHMHYGLYIHIYIYIYIYILAVFLNLFQRLLLFLKGLLNYLVILICYGLTDMDLSII